MALKLESADEKLTDVVFDDKVALKVQKGWFKPKIDVVSFSVPRLVFRFKKSVQPFQARNPSLSIIR